LCRPQNSDSADLSKETLEDQFLLVAAGTNVSKVCKFGDESFRKEVLAQFQSGPRNVTVQVRDVTEDMLSVLVVSVSSHCHHCACLTCAGNCSPAPPPPHLAI